jgi:hypothetical protein
MLLQGKPGVQWRMQRTQGDVRVKVEQPFEMIEGQPGYPEPT